MKASKITVAGWVEEIERLNEELSQERKANEELRAEVRDLSLQNQRLLEEMAGTDL